jgi:type II secretion system protein N
MTRNNKWLSKLGYLFLGTGVFLIFLYVTFPFDLAQQKIVRLVEEKSGCQIEPEGQTARFPLRLQWSNLRVLCPYAEPIALDSLEADIAVFPMIFKQEGEVAFKIKIAEKGGDIAGTIIANKTPEGIAFVLKKDGQGAGIRVNYRGFSGVVAVKGDGRWIGQDVVMGNGVFNFDVKDAHFKNQALPWPLSDISFATITGKVSWKTGEILILHFSAEGETAGLMSRGGMLIVHEPFTESFLSTTLNVSPKGPLKQIAEIMISDYKASEPLKLEITGPIIAPKVLLNGRRVPTAS